MLIWEVWKANRSIYSVMPREMRSFAGRHIFLLALTGSLEIIFLATLIPMFNLITLDDQASHSVAIFSGVEVNNLIAVSAASLIVVSVNFCRILLIRSTAKVAYKTGENLNNIIMINYFSRDYLEFNKLAIDDVLSAVLSKVQTLITSVIQPSLTLVGNLFVTVCLIFILVIKSPIVTAMLILLVLIFYIVVFSFNKKRLEANGKLITRYNSRLSALIRYLRIFYIDLVTNDGFSEFQKDFAYANHVVKSSEANNMLLTQSPRYLFEGAFFVILFISLYVASQLNEFGVDFIETLVLFGVAGMRLFPLAQQTYYLTASTKHGLPTYRDLQSLFITEQSRGKLCDEMVISSLERSKDRQIEKLKVENLSVVLPDGSSIEPISFEAFRGDMITLIGESGSGKTTFLKAMLGLFPNRKGAVAFNDNIHSLARDVGMRKRVGYVSQSPMISGDNLREFFAKNNQSFDELETLEVLRRVGIVFDAPLQDVLVNEFGDNFSGGERQRLCLVCILLNPKKDLLILDEFTSALDDATQADVLNLVKDHCRDKIVISVSHRAELIGDSTKVVEVKKHWSD